MSRADSLMPGNAGALAPDVAPDVALALARLVEALGTPSLAGTVLEFLRSQGFFDSALIVLYPRKRRPHVLFEALAHPLRANDVDAYLAGPYLLDPFRTYAQDLREAALVRLQDITSEDFRSSEYFNNYYLASHLSDELNYLIPIAVKQVVAVSLGRSQSLAPFADAEILSFRNWVPLLSAIFRHPLALPDATGQGAVSQERERREHDELEARLATFGSQALTPREREVVQHLLRGISAPAIAGHLNVSLQTVRVHRRNIYEKLDVSSLGQLFSLAMHSMLAGEV